jgi:hypothetical protein
MMNKMTAPTGDPPVITMGLGMALGASWGQPSSMVRHPWLPQLASTPPKPDEAGAHPRPMTGCRAACADKLLANLIHAD